MGFGAWGFFASMRLLQHQMDIFSDLSWRGLVHQTTDEAQLGQWLRDGSRTLYAGFDPTADSLHVGHLGGIMLLRGLFRTWSTKRSNVRSKSRALSRANARS